MRDNAKLQVQVLGWWQEEMSQCHIMSLSSCVLSKTPMAFCTC